MYVIAEISGLQYKITNGQFLYVPRLNNEVGTQLSYKSVFLFCNRKFIRIGTPYLDGINVNLEVLQHLKADKVIVFKKKRRKGYKVKRGHRQLLTVVKVVKVVSTDNYS